MFEIVATINTGGPITAVNYGARYNFGGSALTHWITGLGASDGGYIGYGGITNGLLMASFI